MVGRKVCLHKRKSGREYLEHSPQPPQNNCKTYMQIEQTKSLNASVPDLGLVQCEFRTTPAKAGTGFSLFDSSCHDSHATPPISLFFCNPLFNDNPMNTHPQRCGSVVDKGWFLQRTPQDKAHLNVKAFPARSRLLFLCLVFVFLFLVHNIRAH